jgi:uncharacterized protein (TIGR02246 family)
MTEDEQAIRGVVAAWMTATRRGDVESVLALMTDDALFLVAGRPPMDRAEFAAAARAQARPESPLIEGVSDIRELQVEGSFAYLWSHLTVTVTPRDGSPVIRRAGHTLTVFRKERGRWLLARDANLL